MDGCRHKNAHHPFMLYQLFTPAYTSVVYFYCRNLYVWSPLKPLDLINNFLISRGSRSEKGVRAREAPIYIYISWLASSLRPPGLPATPNSIWCTRYSSSQRSFRLEQGQWFAPGDYAAVQRHSKPWLEPLSAFD